MITINLLPEAYRKAPPNPALQFYRSPLAIGLIVLCVGVGVVLGMVTGVRQARSQQLQSRMQQFESQKKTTDELAASVKRLRDQQAVFDRLTLDRSQWWKYLNEVSNLTPEGVWFTDLSLDPAKGLVMQGSAISQGGEEMVRIGRLVQELKSSSEIASIIPNIQIESIKSMQDGNIELIQFTLTGNVVP